MAYGRKTGGRQAGTPNRITRDLREMVLQALDDAGGADYLARQANENPRAFLALLAKLLPRPTPAKGDGVSIVDLLTRSYEIEDERLAQGLPPDGTQPQANGTSIRAGS